MLSKAVFIHSHINLAYKTPFIILDLKSRTITAAAQAKDAVLVPSVTQLACENIRFSSLLAAGDVSRETSTAAKSEE